MRPPRAPSSRHCSMVLLKRMSGSSMAKRSFLSMTIHGSGGATKQGENGPANEFLGLFPRCRKRTAAKKTAPSQNKAGAKKAAPAQAAGSSRARVAEAGRHLKISTRQSNPAAGGMPMAERGDGFSAGSNAALARVSSLAKL